MSEGDEQALAGIKVVEFTVGMAGPWIGRFMAYCGAEVIRVESKKVPGVVRLYVPPGDPEQGVQPELSPWLTDWDAGKLFVSLDLSRPEAIELAKQLVARCDIVVENFRYGALERLGLGWEALREVNPGLILFGSRGFGDAGPHPEYVTWGPNIEAMAGMARLSGFPERDCAMTQYAYPDALSGLHGLFAILCALDHRERTGEGQQISLAQLETTVSMLGTEMMDRLAHDREPPKLGNRSLRHAPQGCYRCQGDDRWCAITVTGDAEWRRLCQAMGRPDLEEDPRLAHVAGRRAHADEIDAEIERWTKERPPHLVMELLQELNVAAGAVQTTEDQYQLDDHLSSRGYFEHIPHLRKGEVVAPGIPLGLGGTPGRTTRAGAAIGEDNAHVFRDLLGLGQQDYDRYRRAGAIEGDD